MSYYCVIFNVSDLRWSRKPLGLSPVVADIIGVSKDAKLSKVESVKKLWTHIKEEKLQDIENK